MKKNLFLLVLCLTSTLFVSGQTYKSLNGNEVLTKTSSTTWTIKWGNKDGGVTTKYLTLSQRKRTSAHNIPDNMSFKIYNIKNSADYILIGDEHLSDPINKYLMRGISYYNELDRKMWSCEVYIR